MSRSIFIGRMIVILLSFLIASCSGRDKNETARPTEKTAPTPDGLTRGVGLCANTYYPIHEGATWTYKSTGASSGDYEVTETITAVRKDGFTVTSLIGDEPQIQEWGCTEQGLVTLQLSNSTAATLSTQSVGLDLEMKNASGVTFPKKLEPGQEWSHELEFIGKVGISDTSAMAGGRVHTDFIARGMESITVPAGTFEAMKVDTVTTLDTNMKVQGWEVPSAFTSTSTFWFVKDVGWVKTINQGELGGQSFTEVIELQSFSIP